MKSLRIALLGSRGIPARYGGYETLMEEMAVRLQALGHRVTVYCRSHYTARHEREHHGVELVVLPTLATKYLDTPVHTFLSCLHAASRSLGPRGYDAALVVNAANALFVPLLRIAGIPTALHVDGIEKQRAKWGAFGRLVYSLSERLACHLPSRMVSDAQVIHDHYLRRYGKDSRLITYGVVPQPPAQRGILDKLGLEAGRYFLYVSRFEPENNPHRVARAYHRVSGDLPLVMVGDAPYAAHFIDSFRQDADPRVIFPGAIYGDGYRELQEGALAYVHATEVGGTHPALVEAMGYGNCLLVNDVPENREVVGDCGLWFRARDEGEIVAVFEQVLADPPRALALGTRAAARAQERYSWDAVTTEYADLFASLADSPSAAESDKMDEQSTT